MKSLEEVGVGGQAEHPRENSGEIHPGRKVGIEIVRSASLPGRFFYGPRPRRDFPILHGNTDWSRRVAEAGALR